MVSIVIPVRNEEQNVAALYAKIVESMGTAVEGYEIIFVDDGSTDKTLVILRNLMAKNSKVRVFSFRKNNGKAEALTVGFQKAKGNLIVTLDADLQDRPVEIRKLIRKQKEGFGLVCGWRKDRKDALKTKLSSKLFNFIASIFLGLKLHRDYKLHHVTLNSKRTSERSVQQGPCSSWGMLKH